MGKAYEKPVKDMTPAERAEWRKIQARRSAAYSRIKSINKQAKNRLNKELKKPERWEQEKAFAQTHENESDEQLYRYVKEMRHRRGKSMKPINTIGYSYIVERLGPWDVLMGRIKADLAEEKKLAEARPEPRTMIVRWKVNPDRALKLETQVQLDNTQIK